MAQTMNPADFQRLLGPAGLPISEIRLLAEAVSVRQTGGLRYNLLGERVLKDSDLGFPVRPVPWYADSGRCVDPSCRPARQVWYAAGAYFVQDPSSMLPVALLDPQPGEQVCDVCAAPGGKATAILDQLGRSGSLLANEPVAGRIPMLLANFARHGATRFVVTAMDPGRLSMTFPGRFDAVLVDAPCTGQTLVGAGKQRTAAFSPKRVAHCALRQSRILAAAADLVRPGGRLVYSTCAYSWAENEAQIESLLTQRPDFEPLPDPRLESYRSPGEGPSGCYRLWDHSHGCRGAFAARVRKIEDDRTAGPSGFVGKPKRSAGGTAGSIPFDEWGEWAAPTLGKSARNLHFRWPNDFPADLISEALYGPEAVFQKGKTWFPSHALAMRRDGAFAPRVKRDLDHRQAVSFLAGHELAGGETGWVVATYRGSSLGWMKGGAGRLRNHLPKPMRLSVLAAR